MARRSDRQARKQAKRAAKDIEKAKRRGNVLSLLELEQPLDDPAQLTEIIDLLVRAAEISARQADDARLVQLARACLNRPELSAAIAAADTEALASCGWVLIGAVLRASQWALGEALLGVFERGLEERAPGLLAWLRAYVQHRAAIPPAELDRLPPLSTATVAGTRELRAATASPEQLESALLAADEPDALAALIEGLSALAPDLRDPLSTLASQLAWRASLRYAADPRRLRTALAALGDVGEGDLVFAAIRLARQRLDPLRNAGDLRVLGQLLVRAHATQARRSVVLSTLRAYAAPLGSAVPSDAVIKASVELGRRLLTLALDPDVWAWTADWSDIILAHESYETAPYWLVDAGRAMVDDGSLARALVGRDQKQNRALIDGVMLLPWTTGLRFVAQALEHVGEDSLPDLARLAGDCLREPETDEASKPGRVTVKQLKAKLEHKLASSGFDVELATLIELLETLPPEQVVPPQIAQAGSLELDLSLGPTQLDFVDRYAKQLLPHDGELLFDLLCTPQLRDRWPEFVDMFLGPTADIAKLAWLITRLDGAPTPALLDHTIARLLAAHQHDAKSLLLVLRALIQTDGSRALCKRIAKAVFVAIDAGSSTDDVPADLLNIARVYAGRPRKKKVAKKKVAKKKVAKKKVAKKKVAKKKVAKKKVAKKKVAKSAAGTKKPATKKPATKKPATKKPATKKPATKKPATKKLAQLSLLDIEADE